jgi:hypothetical protein
VSDTNLPTLTWGLSSVVNLAGGHGQDGPGMVETIHDIIDASTYWRVVSEDGAFAWIEIAPKVGEDCEDMRILVRHTVPTNKIRAYTSGADDLYVGIHPDVGGTALSDYDAVDPWGGATGWAFSQYANAFSNVVEDIAIVECEEALHILGLDTGGNLRHAFLGHILDSVSSLNGHDFYAETPAVYRLVGIFASEDSATSNTFWSSSNNFLNYHTSLNQACSYGLRSDGVWDWMARFTTSSTPTTTRHVDAGGREYSSSVPYYFYTSNTFAGTSRQWGMCKRSAGVVTQSVAAVIKRVLVGINRTAAQDAVAHDNT